MEYLDMISTGIIPGIYYDRKNVFITTLKYWGVFPERLKPAHKDLVKSWQRFQEQHDYNNGSYERIKSKIILVLGERKHKWLLNYSRLLYHQSFLEKKGVIDLVTNRFIVEMFEVKNTVNEIFIEDADFEEED